MLKSTADAIASSVTSLFYLSIRSCRLPSSWKISSVVPIPKVWRPSATSDFSLISLLSLLSKVLEQHFHFLISEHIQTHCPLSSCQWGFKEGKSTVYALLNVTHPGFSTLKGAMKIVQSFLISVKPLIRSHTSRSYQNFRRLACTHLLPPGFKTICLRDIRKLCCY